MTMTGTLLDMIKLQVTSVMRNEFLFPAAIGKNHLIFDHRIRDICEKGVACILFLNIAYTELNIS